MCNRLCGYCIVPQTTRSFWTICLFIPLAAMLVCLLVTSTTYRLISLLTSCRCRFQTGPGRRPGRAGPHLQPGGRLGPVQRQRDACCRRPGHMKANALCPVPLLLLLLPLPSFSSSCSSSSSTSHPATSLALPPSTLNPHSITRMLGERGMYWEEKQGTDAQIRLLFTLRQEKNSPSLPPPSFSTAHPPLLPLGYDALGEYLSLLHTKLSVTWE